MESNAGLSAGANAVMDMPVSQVKRKPDLWQPRQPVFWLLLVLAGFGMFTMILSLVAAKAALEVWVVALVAFAVQTAVLLWVARTLPRVRTQSLSLRLGAFLLGSLGAIGLAANINGEYGGFLPAYGLKNFQAAISAPITEDASRMICVIAILALAVAARGTLSVMDGVVYGFLVGAGFEVFENLIYAMRADAFAEALQSALMRMLMGFGLHALWTAIAAGALAYVWSRVLAGKASRWWVIVPAYLLPMLLHMGWDAPGLLLFPLFKFVEWILLYLLTLGAFVAAVRWGRVDERRRYGADGGGSAQGDETDAIHSRTP